jgi:type VI protein secretion system component Hcp
MRRLYLSIAMAVVVLVLDAHVVSAQVQYFNLPDNPPIFLKIPGISGNASSLPQHLGEIEVVSIRQTYSAYTPVTARRPCSLVVVKPLDKSGPALWLAAVTGQVFSQIEVAVVNESNNTPYTAYKITLTNARVVGMTTEGGQTFLETVTFEGASAILAITQTTATGQPLGASTATVACTPGS